MSTLMDIMQSNNWLHDELSEGNPWNAISARGDLVPDGGRWVSPWIERMLYGGLDTKVTISKYIARSHIQHAVINQML
jgi:hypothetical protein